MTGAELREWRLRVGLTQRMAADEIGVSKHAIKSYEVGRRPIPRVVANACARIEHDTFCMRTS